MQGNGGDHGGRELDLTPEEQAALEGARAFSARVRGTGQPASDARLPSEERVVALCDGASVRVRQTGTVVQAALVGEIDGGSAVAFDNALLGAAPAGSRLELDLSATLFLDSAALGVLLATRRRLVHSGGSLHLASVPEPLARIFRVTRLSSLLNVLPPPAADG
ncbi:MAG: hypothetical protein JWO60_168 [Frankiales bacterium]|nr:hypothetical protein [Frankiales bacterium]